MRFGTVSLRSGPATNKRKSKQLVVVRKSGKRTLDAVTATNATRSRRPRRAETDLIDAYIDPLTERHDETDPPRPSSVASSMTIWYKNEKQIGIFQSKKFYQSHFIESLRDDCHADDSEHDDGNTKKYKNITCYSITLTCNNIKPNKVGGAVFWFSLDWAC